MTRRVLVTGSRDWTDREAILETLKFEFQINFRDRGMILVHGDCPTGADFMANEVWENQGLTVEKHPADWNQYGKRAGFIRNQEMVDSKPSICYAFIKNNSKGATHTVKACEKAGIPTFIIRED